VPRTATALDLVAALDAQWALLVEAVAAIGAEDWHAPSALPGWRLADLAGHLVGSAHSSDQVRPAIGASAPLSVGGYLAAYAGAAAAVTAAARTVADGADPDGADPDDVAALLRPAVTGQLRVLTELASRPGADRLVVTTHRGPLRLVDHVATRLIEVVVHADDLERSVDARGAPPAGPVGGPGRRAGTSPPWLAGGALRAVCRTLAGVLAERYPGHAVELRVPPVTAVQCVAGPRHTRGTPPNVVETDPLSWLRLAAGRVRWSELTADGRVRASGDRSDLSGLLPLL